MIRDTDEGPADEAMIFDGWGFVPLPKRKPVVEQPETIASSMTTAE